MRTNIGQQTGSPSWLWTSIAGWAFPIVLLGLSTSSSAGVLSFAPGIDFEAGRGSYSIASGDFDRNGKPDIVTANGDDGTVSVLRFRYDVTLRDKRDFEVTGTTYMTGIAAADVNQDGKLDILVSGCCWNVYVLLGNGDGTFQASMNYPTGRWSYPSGLAIADLNRDGRHDVVTANAVNSVSVMLGNGDGSLEPYEQYPVGDNQGAVAAVALADLNHDGKPDVVTANGFDDTISVLQDQWNGTLKAKRDFPVAEFPRALAVGDVNHDGDPDIIVGSSRKVTVMMGNGYLNFTPGYTFYPAYYVNFRGVALADFDFDGHLDIAMANSVYGNMVLVARGIGDGNFYTPVSFTEPDEPPASNNYGLVVEDINRDSKPDIVTVQDGYVRVLLNNTPR